MYRRPKFLEILHQIREEMSREVDYDVDLFAEMVRSQTLKRDEKERKFDLESLNFDQSTETKNQRPKTKI